MVLYNNILRHRKEFIKWFNVILFCLTYFSTKQKSIAMTDRDAR